MPSNYVRKSTQQSWNPMSMQQAIAAVRGDNMPFATAARQFNVPRSTFKRRVLEKNRDAVEDKKILGSYRCVFNQEQEEELLNHIFDMEQRFYGISMQDLRHLAFQLAEKNNLPHRFNREKRMAGKDWVACFRKRHPNIALRKPESTSMARAQGFNRINENKFFSIFQIMQDEHFYPVHRIYNVDETGLLTVQTRNSKVFSFKGRRQVGVITSAERDLLSTFAVCMSAGGTFIPPFVIFPRKRMKIELQDGAPPGTEFACNSSGWMQTDIFMQWFDHFQKHVKPSEQDPVLLILDGHATHTKNIAFIEKARKNFTTVVCLSPHCSHKLQPLDVSFMAPFKTFYVQACEKFLRNNPGRVITQFQISRLLGEAFLHAAVPTTSINGFRKCGIFPLDPNVFSDVDFVAADVSDTPTNPVNNQLPNDKDSVLSDKNAAVETGLDTTTAKAETVFGHVVRVTAEECAANELEGGATAEGDAVDEENTVDAPEAEVADEEHDSQNVVNSTPKSQNKSFAILSPKDIIPLPKQKKLKQRKTNRKKGKTAIITASPSKTELLQEEKLEKEETDNKKKRKHEGNDVKPSTSKSVPVKKK